MEILLDYVIYALLGHSYSVSPRRLGFNGNIYQWTVTFEENVYLVFDEADVRVLRSMAETSRDPDTIERIS